MDVKNIVRSLLIEQLDNKKLFNSMMLKWYGQNPTPQQLTDGEEIFTNFIKIKQRLSIEMPQVVTFLYRFDGNTGEKFDPKNLKDVSKYSLDQIKFLVGEFVTLSSNLDDSEDDGEDPLLKGVDLPPTKERIEASKKLWFSKGPNLIIDEEGFRVYYIPNQKTSINFGYFAGWMSKQENAHQWCVTEHKISNNLWTNYRKKTSDNRTFYFVIDESKNIRDKYYIGALQRQETKFRLTSPENDGDNYVSVTELADIYPKIKNHLNKIINVEYDEKELVNLTDPTQNILNRVNETNGDRYEFSRMDRRMKLRFIENSKCITREKSWKSMDEELRKKYIEKTTNGDMYVRFSTMELMEEIKKTPRDLNFLSHKLNILGIKGGITPIIERLMKDFKGYRTSMKKQNIQIYRSLRDDKFGIYDNAKLGWFTMNGVEYGPKYTLVDEPYIDEEGNEYVVESYTMDGVEDDKSFYCVFPVQEINIAGRGYFISHKKWLELKDKIHPDDEGVGTIDNFDPETDSDIQS